MTPESPCVGVCRLDPRGETCLGCGRRLDEIARWSTMSDAERARVLARLARSEAQDAGQKAQRDQTEENPEGEFEPPLR